jgi:hypothetical protein
VANVAFVSNHILAAWECARWINLWDTRQDKHLDKFPAGGWKGDGDDA